MYERNEPIIAAIEETYTESKEDTNRKKTPSQIGKGGYSRR